MHRRGASWSVRGASGVWRTHIEPYKLTKKNKFGKVQKTNIPMDCTHRLRQPRAPRRRPRVAYPYRDLKTQKIATFPKKHPKIDFHTKSGGAPPKVGSPGGGPVRPFHSVVYVFYTRPGRPKCRLPARRGVRLATLQALT